MSNTEDNPTPLRLFISFVLTLIAVPFLFAATCVPLGYASLTAIAFLTYTLKVGKPVYAAYVFGGFLALFTIAFISFGIWRAVRTENPGIRWGIVVGVTALAIAAIVLVVTSWDFLLTLH